MPRKHKVSAADAFRNAFGAGTKYRDFTDQDDARLAKRLPTVMLDIIRQEGWCSYADQVLWLCDPDDWQASAAAWLPSSPVTEVFVRTGFGDLFVWDGSEFQFVDVHASMVILMVPDADWFFSQSLPDPQFAPRNYLPQYVGAAREQAGPLHWDEMYSYVPALALGGSRETSRIERVKAKEALSILATLAPIELH